MRTDPSTVASKISDAGRKRVALNGATMGTRYSAVLFARPGDVLDGIPDALAASVALVDRQMSTWRPDSDLMRFNRAPVGGWVDLPRDLITVVETGLDVGRQSGGAFDIGLFDLVSAWGFSGDPPDLTRIESLPAGRCPTYELLEVDHDGRRLRKLAAVELDLSGIAKGFGVDRLSETLLDFGITDFLVSIDGEVGAMGIKPVGTPWRVAVEAPDPNSRDVGGIVELRNAALATSGNYRHRTTIDGHNYSHTMDPATARPLNNGISAVTVEAPTCMLADAWATAVMVMGPDRGLPLVNRLGMRALIAQVAP